MRIWLYAGKPGVSLTTAALVKNVGKALWQDYGDNVQGAENQQERLITPDWVVGFVDGEGCFSIGLVRQAGGANRKGYRLGYQVSHSFSVVQGDRSRSVLESLRIFFGAGRLHVNRRHDDHRGDMHHFVVSRRADLRDVIIPFFRGHPLRTAKQRDFEHFAKCVELVATGQHLKAEGLVEVLESRQRMNRCKPRTELIRILRGHTPDIRVGQMSIWDEEMVQTARRRADQRRYLDGAPVTQEQ